MRKAAELSVIVLPEYGFNSDEESLFGSPPALLRLERGLFGGRIEGMRVMPVFSYGWARSLAVACAFGAIVGVPTINQAFAGDDGQAPIWKGLGDLVGLSGLAGMEDKQPPIQYRERARLVLPPKMTLPTPASPAAEKTAAWPVDPDLEKVRKENAATRAMLMMQSDTQAERDGNRLTPDQLRADHAPPGQKVAGDRRCGAQSNSRGCDWVPFRNVFETIGLAKSDEVVAGQEPDRDWLTDPPKGYRLPTSNTVATFDAKKTVNQSDPRSTLYVAPEQQ